jgi:hypothetical protein
MADGPIDRFNVDIEPEERSGSFWQKLLFLRVDTVGELAAQSVAAEQGGTAQSALPGSRIVIGDTTTGNEVWHINASDLTGGTSLDQLQTDIGDDLSALTIEQLRREVGHH